MMRNSRLAAPPVMVMARGVKRHADGMFSFMLYTNIGMVLHEPTWWFDTESDAEAAANEFKDVLTETMTEAGISAEALPENVHMLN